MSDPIKPKKSPWRIALYIIAGLAFAFVALVAYSYWSFHNRFIARSKNVAAQSLLQQLAVAQVACLSDTGRYFLDWEESLKFGFRPDPNVRVKLIVFALDINGHKVDSFMATANHARGKKVYFYDIQSGAGVTELPRAKPLGDEYAFHIERPDGYSGNTIVIKNGGPPIVSIWVRLPLPGTANLNSFGGRPGEQP